MALSAERNRVLIHAYRLMRFLMADFQELHIHMWYVIGLEDNPGLIVDERSSGARRAIGIVGIALTAVAKDDNIVDLGQERPPLGWMASSSALWVAITSAGRAIEKRPS